MRARIKGGVENVSRSVVMHHDSSFAIHAARDTANYKVNSECVIKE